MTSEERGETQVGGGEESTKEERRPREQEDGDRARGELERGEVTVSDGDCMSDFREDGVSESGIGYHKLGEYSSEDGGGGGGEDGGALGGGGGEGVAQDPSAGHSSLEDTGNYGPPNEQELPILNRIQRYFTTPDEDSSLDLTSQDKKKLYQIDSSNSHAGYEDLDELNKNPPPSAYEPMADLHRGSDSSGSDSDDEEEEEEGGGYAGGYMLLPQDPDQPTTKGGWTPLQPGWLGEQDEGRSEGEDERRTEGEEERRTEGEEERSSEGEEARPSAAMEECKTLFEVCTLLVIYVM